MAKNRKKRQSYTPEQRNEILDAASRDKLTAAQVKRKFGVTPVTYYSWRKKSGSTRPHGEIKAAKRVATSGAAAGSELGNQLRAEVQNRVRQILPEIVRNEVNSYLNTLFSAGSGQKRGQKV